MITNDTELEVVRKQLAHVDAALADLRRNVLPKSESMFNLFAEAPLELRSSIQADIDRYLENSAPTCKALPSRHDSSEKRLLELT